MKQKRWFSYVIISIVYIISLIIGFFAYQKFNNLDLALRLLVADVVMTLVVFSASIAFKNSSIYDPYWSVIPVVVVCFFGFNNFSRINLLMIVPVVLWGVRLTLNWAIRFKGLEHIDFRYVQLKEKHPKMWPIINLLGIHLFPTIVVYLMMLPMVAYFGQHQVILNGGSIIAILLMLFGILIEMISDAQMMKFKKRQKEKNEKPTFIYCGLWKKSRHPNYFGEIVFWFGVYLLMLSVFPASKGTGEWALFVGPLVNLIMFVFISIPLMEKKLLKKYPNYKVYQQNTNMLLPFFPKTKEDITM